jgi:hypothetical protein
MRLPVFTSLTSTTAPCRVIGAKLIGDAISALT